MTIFSYLTIEAVVLFFLLYVIFRFKLKQSIRTENQQIKREKEFLEEANLEFKKNIKEIQSKLNENEEYLKETQQQKIALEIQKAKNEEQLKNLNEKILDGTAIIKELKEQNKIIGQKADQFQEDREKLSSTKSTLTAELEQINAVLLEKRENLSENKNTIRLKDEKISNLITSKEKLEKNVSELTTQIEQEQKRSKEKLEILENARDDLKKEFENLANKIFDAKNIKGEKKFQELMKPLREQLKEFRDRVNDVYDKDSEGRTKLHAEIKHLQNLNKQISEDAENLTKALKGDSKIQGNWGEIVLEKLLEFAGLEKGVMFETQVSLKDETGKRFQPDVIIHLPDKRDVLVDSKVSLTAYEEFFNEDDEIKKQKALDRHLISVNNHINELSKKNYENLQGVNSLDWVFMFIPIEGAFISAIQNSKDAYQRAMKKKIILVGPTTLLATLRTIENFWKFKKQTENAKEIAQRGSALYDKFVNFVESLDDIGKHIERASNSYNEAKNRLSTGRGNLIRQSEMLKNLGIQTKKQLPDGFKD